MRRIDIAAFLVIATIVVAACGGATPSSAATGAPSVPPSGTPGSPSGQPSVAPASEQPTDTAPTEAPSETPASSPSGSPDAAAAACTGTDDNRTFFEDAASRLDWAVLCAVLPKGWFVSAGNFTQKQGGSLTISYKGPNGATIALSEGAWCKDAAGCAPAGTEVGPAAFGPLAGTLFKLDDGGFAVVVAGGETPSWQFQAEGIGKSKATTLAAAAVEVGN
jgi:hypothetical protein